MKRSVEFIFKTLAGIGVSVTLVGCFGDGGDPVDLQGTAAIGMPVSGGAVRVKCAAGSALQTVTDANGDWSVTFSGQTMPCAIQVSGGNLPGGITLHSVALQPGVANVTPLTDLIVANLAGENPADWFASFDADRIKNITNASIATALTHVRDALKLSVLNNIDPLRTEFQARRGNPMDDILEAMANALDSAGLSYSQLTTAAQNTGAFLALTSFSSALASAHDQIVTGGKEPGTGGNNPSGGNGSSSGGGSTGGSGSGGAAGNNYTLTLNVNAAGVATTTVLKNVAKPSTESEFCGEISNPSSSTSLSQQLQGAAGSLRIDSCSFNGTVGNVSATLSITSPVSITVPYSVVYTYSQ